jgi:hypothetical protein
MGNKIFVNEYGKMNMPKGVNYFVILVITQTSSFLENFTAYLRTKI